MATILITAYTDYLENHIDRLLEPFPVGRMVSEQTTIDGDGDGLSRDSFDDGGETCGRQTRRPRRHSFTDSLHDAAPFNIYILEA